MNSLEAIFVEVIFASGRATLLIALVVLLRAGVQKLVPARLFFPAWLIVAATLLVPFAVPVTWRPASFSSVSIPANSWVDVSIPVAPNALSLVQPAEVAPTRSVESSINSTKSDAPFISQKNLLFVGAWIWIGGVSAILAVRLFSRMLMLRRLRGAQPSLDGRVARCVEKCRVMLGMSRKPVVLITGLITTPAVYGAWRPCLLLPLDFAAKLSDAELELVVLHEFGHLRRRDLLAHLLIQTAKTVHWFNPLVWLVARLARTDCELACDEFVLRHVGASENLTYGQTLLKVLSESRGDGLPAAVGIVEGKRQLLKRFSMITNYHPQTFRRSLTGVTLLMGITFIGYTRAAQETAGKTEPSSETLAAQKSRAPFTGEQLAEMRAKRLAVTLEWEKNAKIELRAVGNCGGIPLAVIDVNGEPAIVGTTGGIGLASFSVTAIDEDRGQVTLTARDQTKRVLTLTDPRAIKFPQFSETRIKQMIVSGGYGRTRQKEMVPPEVVMAWSKINRDGKEQILLNYLQRGILVNVLSDPTGMTGTSGLLFEPQIIEWRKTLKEPFLASLTAEQREAYAGGAQPVIAFTAPPAEREAQATRAHNTEVRMKKVIDGLTPAQRKLYDTWMASFGQPASG